MSASLDTIRAEIDALDADLRALLLARADLVAQIAAAKAAKAADGAATSPLRPEREMQQMAGLLAWHGAHAAQLPVDGLIAIWREIIGMALAQQGGLTIYASAAAMPMARAHFGASLRYVTSNEPVQASLNKADALAVVELSQAIPPAAGQAILARLPLRGGPAALVYGRAAEDTPTDGVVLVARQAVKAGERELVRLGDLVLVETDNPGDDAVWGRYLTLGDEA